MKIFKWLFIITLSLTFGCKDGYIDDITHVEPGPDEAAPVVNIDYPNEGTQIRVREDVASINIQFEVIDDIEIQDISVAMDGNEITSFSDFNDYRRAVEEYLYDELTNGPHTLTVTATDLSGKSTTGSVNFEKIEPYTPLDGEIFYMPFDGDYFELVTIIPASDPVSTSFTNGIKGQAVGFNAASPSYLLFDSTSSIEAVESLSVSFWVNVQFVDNDNSGGIDGILGLVNFSNVSSFWGNLDIFIENNSNPTDGADMRIHAFSGADTWITNVNDVQNVFGEWSNHIITYDASTSEFKYYINGTLMTTATAGWSGPIDFTNAGPIVMGTVQFQTTPSLTSATGSQTWASYLTGAIDEVRIFNKALSEEEIQAIIDDVN